MAATYVRRHWWHHMFRPDPCPNGYFREICVNQRGHATEGRTACFGQWWLFKFASFQHLCTFSFLVSRLLYCNNSAAESVWGVGKQVVCMAI